MKECVIISGAPESNIEYYKPIIKDKFVICADSGYKKCMSLSVEPDLIIGDFDSSPVPKTDTQIIVLPVQKDDTDTAYCVKEAVKRGFGKITILGAVGSRVDHTYSNILCLYYCFERGVQACIINDKNYIRIFDNSITIHNDYYKYFSLFAFMGDCEGLSIHNSLYDLDTVTLKMSNPLCQSNSFKDGEVTISVKKGKILLIQSND